MERQHVASGWPESLQQRAEDWPSPLRRAALVLAALLHDLSPTAGQPLPGLQVRNRYLVWLPHAVAVLLGIALGIVTGMQTLHHDASIAAFQASALGIAQGAPLLLVLYRPTAGWWMSLVVGVWVSETARGGGEGSVWSEPSLLVHLGVLAIVALGARPRVLVEMWLLTLAAGFVLVERMPGLAGSTDLAEMSVMSGVVLIVAGAVRGRGEAQRRLAVQELVNDAERSRRALLEERTRIARELHDVVAHHMSVIAIQAEAAPYRVADPPQELTRSFGVVRSNALEALTELRRVLGVLRAEEPGERRGVGEPGAGAAGSGEVGAAGEAGAETAPQPTLDRLEDLVANSRGAGLSVDLHLQGQRRPLPQGVELSAYRIVQEALTNAGRHAPGSRVHVEATYHPEALELRVVNSPTPPGGSSLERGATRPRRVAGGSGPRATAMAEEHTPGHGILGMRERAAMLGGELRAGRTADGGYVVVAVLPTYRDSPQEEAENTSREQQADGTDSAADD